MWNNKLEPKKPDALTGDSQGTTDVISFPQNDTLMDHGIDWWNSTRRIHIEEKIREIFFIYLPMESNVLSHLVVLIIFETINVLKWQQTHHAVCRCCSFLVPCRKVCFRELFDSLLCATLDIFRILYLWKLGHVVIDFQCVVASGSDRTLISSKAFYIILFLYFLKYIISLSS